MEYSSSSTYSQRMLHSIYYSSILPLPIPKNYQKEFSLKYPGALITLYNVCAVPWGVFSTVGDIMSTVGRCHEYRGEMS